MSHSHAEAIPEPGNAMTKAQRRVLGLLADGRWHSEDTLATAFWFLQQMEILGLVTGAMKTFGGTKQDRLWRMT